MKTSKIWLGVGVAVVAGAVPASPMKASELQGSTSMTAASQFSAQDLPGFIIAQTKQGEGGENESGEGGIDAGAADKDPVKYGVALQVIAAHYHAGLAAYEAGELAAGTQMFAHGHSEVFAEMEDVFKKRGVTGLGAKLEAAIDAANKKAPAAEVRKIVDQVYAALAEAEKAAPKSSLTPLAVKAQIIADMLDRAAAQYVLVLKKDSSLETYLDGLGFARAANREAASLLPELQKANPTAAAAIRNALEVTAAAYPGMKRGAPADAGKLLAAASAARIAAGNVK